MHEFNFVAEGVSQYDMDMFLGPIEPTDGPLIRFPKSWTMAHVVHGAGIFKSIGEARRNGWDKPIPRGYQHLVLTKKKIHVYTLNDLL